MLRLMMKELSPLRIVLFQFALTASIALAAADSQLPVKRAQAGKSQPVAGTPADAISSITAKAEVQLDAGKYKKSVELFEKALTDGRLVGAQRGRAVVLLARSQRLAGSPFDAVATLTKLLETKDPLHYIEIGEAYFAQGEYDSAIKAISIHSKKDSADIQSRSQWVKARADYALRRYLPCVDSCKLVISNVAAYKAETKAEKKITEELDKIAKDATDLMEKALEAHDTGNYGLDYAFYRKARKADFAAKYDIALLNYGKIKDGILRQAADLYTARCLAAKAEGKEAKKKLKDIVADGFAVAKDTATASSESANPYAGEAAIDLAEAEYIELGPEQALKRLEWFDEWAACEEKCAIKCKEEEKVAAKEKKPVLNLSKKPEGLEILAGINEALWNDVIDKAPKKYLDTDEFGNLSRTAKSPESIVNARTSPWYLPLLRTRAAILKGHMLSETGEKDKAVEVYNSVPSAGGEVKIITDKVVVDTLLAGVSEGFPPPLNSVCAKKVRKERARPLALACLDAITGEPRKAAERLKSIAGAAEADNHQLERRTVLFCLGSLQADSGEMAAAETTLRSSIRERNTPPTSIDDQIGMTLAGVLARDGKTLPEAANLYRKVAERKNTMAPAALLSLALAQANGGNLDGAWDACAQILLRHPESKQAPAAATLAKAVDPDGRKASKPGSPKLPERNDGKLVRHVRTIVVPGGAEWEADPSQLTKGDIVQYNIRCISRDNCTIIRNFCVGVGAKEPQPPRSKTNEIVFYRAPVLSLPGLTRELDGEPGIAK